MCWSVWACDSRTYILRGRWGRKNGLCACVLAGVGGGYQVINVCFGGLFSSLCLLSRNWKNPVLGWDLFSQKTSTPNITNLKFLLYGPAKGSKMPGRVTSVRRGCLSSFLVFPGECVAQWVQAWYDVAKPQNPSLSRPVSSALTTNSTLAKHEKKREKDIVGKLVKSE